MINSERGDNMKFGDKLISLRKKAGLSQEELASKLNVSRQSVSKWESNNTYPETDKIVQICNIFDCRMDDLINDKVSDITQCERKNKNNFGFIFDSLLEFVTKSINMFGSMKFTSGLRCVVELGILALCLFVLVIIISEGGSSIVMNLVGFLPDRVYWAIREVICAILQIIGAGFSVIVFIHVFKIRYLDYYDKVINENKENTDNVKVENEKTTEKNPEKKNFGLSKFQLKKEPKVIIRDEKHTTYAFLSIISKIVIWTVKFFVAMFVLCFIVSLVVLVICLVLSISFSKYSMMFIGADIGIIAAIVINVIILLLMIYFIINKKTNLKIMSYIFLISLILFGVGCGIGLLELSEFKITDEALDDGEIVEKTIYLTYKDNMVIFAHENYGSIHYNIKVDNSMDDKSIKVIGKQEKAFFKSIRVSEEDIYGMNGYYLYNNTFLNFDEFMRLFKKDLENKILRSYYVDDGEIEIVCNDKVANKLIENAKKIYLVEMEKTSAGYLISDYEDKIEIDSSCDVAYDAKTGKFTYDDGCVCEKKVKNTVNGDMIDFECYYKTENYLE